MKGRREMKKYMALSMVVVLVLALFAGCGGSTTKKAEKPYQIGVSQLVEHAALDASYQGFLAALKDKGLVEGTDFVIDFQNAQGEQVNANTIATKFVNDKKALILAIATPSAQAAANATTDIPILVTAVTDPKDAGLVKSNEAPGTNVSGTSDLTPVAEQLKLMMKLLPETKTVGLLYCSSESNSVFQANLAKTAATELGLTTVDYTVSNSNEIQQVVQSMVGKVDAIYAPTDNMIAAGMATVSQVATEAKIPVIVGEEGMVANGGLATSGINYYKLGYLTGEMAYQILVEGADISKMPIQYLTDLDVTINTDVAKALGITIPADLASTAKMVTLAK